MKMKKKILPTLLTGTLVITSVTPVWAAGSPSEKEEVIYINLTGEGAVKDIYAVNISGKGDITDYGDYSSVEMLNTSDEILQDGDKITYTSSGDRVYYQGTMKKTEIPWKISIEYYLDGEKYPAEEIARKSGDLKICFKVTENKEAEGDFFENYALQAAFTLDTEKCSNIVADGATLANVGSDKQISYTMLPGEGIDATITAEVTEFEMGAVSINGVPLSLDVEVDDEEMMEQITDLLEAIEKLDEGAGELNDGASELKDAANKDLKSGVDSLSDGARQHNNGTASLKNGISEVGAGLSLLNGNSAILTGGLGKNVDGYSELSDGSQKVLNGSNELKKGTENLYAKTGELLSGIVEIYQATGRLKDGTTELYEETYGMDNEISDKIDEMLENITGDESEVVSFVSQKNTNVDSVQFVNKTDAIEMEDVDKVEEEPEEELTFVQKVMRLFGMY